MADKILHDIEMPVCVGYGTEANLLNTTGKAWLGELAISTDTAILFACPADGVAMLPVVEQWRASESTDTAPNDDTTPKRLTLQKLASPPSNAAYIAFSQNPGSDTFYLVLEEAS